MPKNNCGAKHNSTFLVVDPEKPKNRPRPPRVLVVDDQADALRLLQLRLEKGGMECIAFQEAEAALDFLKKDPLVDVIILDVMMPVMDGYQACRRIKADPRVKDIPVIFLTAKLDASDKVQGLEIGGHDYLGKPVQQQELIARTRAAIRVKQLQDELKEKLALQNEIQELHRGMLSEHWLKTLGQLAASLAHEINNPLAAALGNVQLLLMQPNLNPEVLHPLRIVDESLQRTGRKLRSLLMIAQTGNQTQELPLGPLLEDLVTAINFQAVINKVSVTSELETDCRWKGAPGDLARALLYVFNNAIEAVEGVPVPHVHVQLHGVEGKNRISICDNGCGMEPVVKARVFDPFFSTKALHHGVGLYLASQIMEQVGGSIEVISPSESWSTEVRIQLPITNLRESFS